MAFWIARMVTGSAAAGWLVKSIFFSWLDIFSRTSTGDYIENIQNLFDNQLASNHIRNQFLIGIQRLGHRKLLIAF